MDPDGPKDRQKPLRCPACGEEVSGSFCSGCGRPAGERARPACCENCGCALTGSFCARCGQQDVNLHRPILGLVQTMVRDTLDIDGRALRTLRTLLLEPGVLTSDFLAGRRRRYTPPFRMYLIISVLFFVCVAWFASRGVLLDAGPESQTEARHQASFVAETLPRLMFVLLPVFALLLKWVFSNRLYFDHLIMSLHFHCAAFIVLALIVPLERVASAHWLPLVAQLVLFAWLLVYFYAALREVYRESRAASATKGLLVLLGYLLAFAVAVWAAHAVGRALPGIA